MNSSRCDKNQQKLTDLNVMTHIDRINGMEKKQKSTLLLLLVHIVSNHNSVLFGHS